MTQGFRSDIDIYAPTHWSINRSLGPTLTNLAVSSDVYKGYSGVMLKPRRMYEADIFPDARPIREDGFPVMLESDL